MEKFSLCCYKPVIGRAIRCTQRVQIHERHRKCVSLAIDLVPMTNAILYTFRSFTHREPYVLYSSHRITHRHAGAQFQRANHFLSGLSASSANENTSSGSNLGSTCDSYPAL